MTRTDLTANNKGKVAARPWIAFVFLAAALPMVLSSGGGEGCESEFAATAQPVSVW